MAEKAVYSWKYSWAVPAQVAGEYLEQLAKDKGELTPELILNESRDEKAVLHPCFEWDDEKAAEGYRLYQAGKILRDITVKIEREENTPPRIVRAYVNVTDQQKHEKGAYVSIDIAMKNCDYKAQVLKNALYELQTFKNKYAQYVELEKVFDAINEFEKIFLEEIQETQVEK